MAQKILSLIVRFAKGEKPTHCPYCESTDIDDQGKFVECRDCGRTWSY